MTLLSIQYLRAVASIMVVLFHLAVPLQRMGFTGDAPGWLAGGVDVFFVISGVIMWVTTAGRPVTPQAFYRRRIIRIVPLYWLLTSLLLAVLMIYPAALQSARFDLGHVVASYLFLPAHHPVTGLLEPLLIPGWTLNYEMFFYLLFGAALLLPAAVRLPAVLAALAGLALAGPALPQGSAIGFYTNPIILEFGLGMLLGWAHGAGARLNRWVAIGLIAAGWAAMIMAGADQYDPLRLLLWGMPAVLIVAGALSLDRAGAVGRWGPALLLGDASYALYLFHGIVLSAAGQAWRLLGLDQLPFGLIGFAVLGFAATLIAGIAVHLGVERPITRLLQPRAAG
jgi:peptidoglycan/LPS O-acetylase OafA/YrhL